MPQAFEKPHFHYNPNDPKASAFAAQLIGELGQNTEEDCDAIFDIGGDGTTLRAFHKLPNVPNFSLKPPGSNSMLFTGHQNIKNASELKMAFENAAQYTLPSLKLDLTLSDGTTKIFNSYADVVVRSFNSQALIPEILINGDLYENTMLCGVIVATPLGSTALNETRGGHVLKLNDRHITLTLDGITNPQERMRIEQQDKCARALHSSSKINISVSPESTKRLVHIDFDNQTIAPDGQLIEENVPITIDTTLRHITNISVHVDPYHTRTLLLNQDYRTPAYAIYAAG